MRIRVLVKIKCFTQHYRWVYEGLGIVLNAGAAIVQFLQILSLKVKANSKPELWENYKRIAMGRRAAFGFVCTLLKSFSVNVR